MNPAERIRVPVRFPPASHRMLTDAAAREGISLAEYVREAALMRMAWELGLQRAGGNYPPAVREALAEIRAVLAEERRAQ